ncbi:tyrosine-type recombinase/integrase [Prodigiosinella aquatilis]|nr:integrase arm-type DNA-binding domain-containing protein [Prodigiosinella sp. LS101]WJV53619.1 tyrosine-type recombinase/integrase [Prodigiosinella sp. LS101]WJV57978.1 tyrosine-type recombinase/integrase [Pectobacteriaceae bacterium C111]
MPLTDAKIRSTKSTNKPIKLADGGGLYLEVRPSGSKLWRYRYRIAGKENVFALGEYPTLSLAEARAEHDKARALVKQAIHPAHQRQLERMASHSANANTFEAVAREWIDKKSPDWTPYYLRQVERFLAADVFPVIGKLPIKSVRAAHLLEIIKRIEGRGAETVALLIRQWSSAIFRYAVATLRADSDPAAALKGAIRRPKVEHHKPLSRTEIADFMQALNRYGGYRTTVIALKLMLLTFVRTVELRKAEWREFDLDGAEWRIPAGRMKMREEHIVPLSTQAIVLLRELQTYTGGRGWLFPNYRNPQDCMTATTLNRALERMGFNGKDSIGFSAHGFRATASTILNEMGYRPDVIERQLAHTERNKVRASYNRAVYLDERRKMMQEWADFVGNLHYI